MKITIKRTRKTDEVMEIVEELENYFDEDSYRELRRDSREDILYGAFDEEGVMLGFIIFCELNPQVIEITWMAVSKKSQGQGVGKKLLTSCLKEVNKTGRYEMCYTKTIGEGDRQRSFEGTRQFYFSLGFIPLESVKPYPGWHKDKYVQVLVKCLKHR